eukprot:gene2140-2556_t
MDATERDPWIQSLYPVPSRTRGRRNRWYGSVSRSSVWCDSFLMENGPAAGVNPRSLLGIFRSVGEGAWSSECVVMGSCPLCDEAVCTVVARVVGRDLRSPVSIEVVWNLAMARLDRHSVPGSGDSESLAAAGVAVGPFGGSSQVMDGASGIRRCIFSSWRGRSAAAGRLMLSAAIARPSGSRPSA